MMRAACCCALLVTGCASVATRTSFYPLDELRTLDPVEDRAEVLAHALEVAPSERTAAWRTAVERAAIATLGEVEVKSVSSAEQALQLADAQLAKFTVLKKSERWLATRVDVAIASFGWVLRGSETREWGVRVLDFAKADTTTPHLAQRLAEEVVMKQLIPSAAVPFFVLALERDGAAVCSAPSLPRVMVEAATYGDAPRVLTKACWEQLQPAYLEAIKQADTRTAKLKQCAAMSEQATQPAVKAACTFE